MQSRSLDQHKEGFQNDHPLPATPRESLPVPASHRVTFRTPVALQGVTVPGVEKGQEGSKAASLWETKPTDKGKFPARALNALGTYRQPAGWLPSHVSWAGCWLKKTVRLVDALHPWCRPRAPTLMLALPLGLEGLVPKLWLLCTRQQAQARPTVPGRRALLPPLQVGG